MAEKEWSPQDIYRDFETWLAKLSSTNELKTWVLLNPEQRIIYSVREHFRNHQLDTFIAEMRDKNAHISKKVVSVEEFGELKAQVARFGSGGEQGVSAEMAYAKSILSCAAGYGASDIHIEVSERPHIQYRINSAMSPETIISKEAGEAICRVLYDTFGGSKGGSASFNPSAPQDGRIQNPDYLPDGVHGVRIASTPLDGSNAFYMVLRMLYYRERTGTVRERLTELGYHGSQVNQVEYMIAQPYGLNLISGATGSGKSTTLMHIMEAIKEARPDLNIISVENPPEYPIRGVRQLPVTGANSQERKSSFAQAIESAMRLDPDILMVGEVRDPGSAQALVEAALTGHQVWGSIHANTTFSIIERLVGLLAESSIPNPKELLTSSSVVTGLISQSLAQTLCPHCSLSLMENRERLNQGFVSALAGQMELDRVRIQGSKGCPKCGHTGITGRTVISEVVTPDTEIMGVVASEGVAKAAQVYHGERKTLSKAQHAIDKVKNGVVDPLTATRIVSALNLDEYARDGVLDSEEMQSISDILQAPKLADD